MRKFLILAGVTVLTVLTGCTGMTRIVKQLARDPATVHLTVRSIYATIELDRTNPTTNTPPHTVKDGSIEVTK